MLLRNVEWFHVAAAAKDECKCVRVCVCVCVVYVMSHQHRLGVLCLTKCDVKTTAWRNLLQSRAACAQTTPEYG